MGKARAERARDALAARFAGSGAIGGGMVGNGSGSEWEEEGDGEEEDDEEEEQWRLGAHRHNPQQQQRHSPGRPVTSGSDGDVGRRSERGKPHSLRQPKQQQLKGHHRAAAAAKGVGRGSPAASPAALRDTRGASGDEHASFEEYEAAAV